MSTYEQFEDRIRLGKKPYQGNQYSPYCDLVYYPSSQNPALRLAMRILKPVRPSYILVSTHGWHMSMPDFRDMKQPDEMNTYLKINVDMRGRAFSDGNPDCNGWELLDVIDAVNYAREHYKEYILDSSIVYFEGGSGGGGNAYGIVGKFPDFFAACTALCGITDYGMWYDNDRVEEFRDEMDVWIGCPPSANPSAYKARSGLYLLENLHTPLFAAHGETDDRVPIEHARRYVQRARELGKENLVQYLELKGVGTRDHWGNATREQMEEIRLLSERNRSNSRKAVELPDKGKMVVGGYLFTKKFSVVLDSMDKIAVLEYDLQENKFTVRCDEPCEYEIKCIT